MKHFHDYSEKTTHLFFWLFGALGILILTSVTGINLGRRLKFFANMVAIIILIGICFKNWKETSFYIKEMPEIFEGGHYGQMKSNALLSYIFSVLAFLLAMYIIMTIIIGD